jgi:hypothetical protein
VLIVLCCTVYFIVFLILLLVAVCLYDPEVELRIQCLLSSRVCLILCGFSGVSNHCCPRCTSICVRRSARSESRFVLYEGYYTRDKLVHVGARCLLHVRPYCTTLEVGCLHLHLPLFQMPQGSKEWSFAGFYAWKRSCARCSKTR